MDGASRRLKLQIVQLKCGQSQIFLFLFTWNPERLVIASMHNK